MKTLNLVVLSGEVAEDPTVEILENKRFIDFYLDIPVEGPFPEADYWCPIPCRVYDQMTTEFALACRMGTPISIVGEIGWHDSENENGTKYIKIQTFNILKDDIPPEQNLPDETVQDNQNIDDLPFDY